MNYQTIVLTDAGHHRAARRFHTSNRGENPYQKYPHTRAKAETEGKINQQCNCHVSVEWFELKVASAVYLTFTLPLCYL